MEVARGCPPGSPSPPHPPLPENLPTTLQSSEGPGPQGSRPRRAHISPDTARLWELSMAECRSVCVPIAFPDQIPAAGDPPWPLNSGLLLPLHAPDPTCFLHLCTCQHSEEPCCFPAWGQPRPSVPSPAASCIIDLGVELAWPRLGWCRPGAPVRTAAVAGHVWIWCFPRQVSSIAQPPSSVWWVLESTDRGSEALGWSPW